MLNNVCKNKYPIVLHQIAINHCSWSSGYVVRITMKSAHPGSTLSWHGFSQGSICLMLVPRDLSTNRMAFTSSVSSEGSREASWSLPFQLLSRVTWRSMTFAPRATAATEMWTPDSWPEYPMGISGNSFWYSYEQDYGSFSCLETCILSGCSLNHRLALMVHWFIT